MNKIKSVRESEGVTQDKLAWAVGISPVTLRSIENNEGYKTSHVTALKIADYLNVDIDDIFTITKVSFATARG